MLNYFHFGCLPKSISFKSQPKSQAIPHAGIARPKPDAITLTTDSAISFTNLQGCLNLCNADFTILLTYLPSFFLVILFVTKDTNFRTSVINLSKAQIVLHVMPSAKPVCNGNDKSPNVVFLFSAKYKHPF